MERFGRFARVLTRVSLAVALAGAAYSVQAEDTLKRAKSVDDKASIRDALVATNLNTVVGPIAWGKGPVKNVAKTPLVGGQWVKGKRHKFDLVIVSNITAPNIPVGGRLKPIT